MRFIAVLNRDGGTFKTTDMDAFVATATEIFVRHGHEIECRVVSGEALLEALETAAGDGEALLAGGGDGTVSAAAGIAFAENRPLAILPAGTMNLFARSLQMPLALDAALEAIASGALRDVDIATANGRPFIHQFSVGLHTKLVKLRENLSYGSRVGKILASCRAVASVIRHPPNFRADIVTKRGIERRTCSGISVSNNPFGEGHVPHADVLDAGLLGVYVAKPMSTWALARLSVSVMVGRWKDNPQVIEREVTQVTLNFPRKKSSALAVIDGELIDLDRQVDIRIHPGALKIIGPVPAPVLVDEKAAA